MANVGRLTIGGTHLSPSPSICLAAVVVRRARPAIERPALRCAVGLGARFGIAAYAAVDRTGLTLLHLYAVSVALVDLAWGTALTGSVSGAAFPLARVTA